VQQLPGPAQHPGRVAADSDIPVRQENPFPSPAVRHVVEHVALHGRRPPMPGHLYSRGRAVHPEGMVVAEIDARETGICTRSQRWETQHHVGQWFPWAHVGSDAVEALAASAGLAVHSTMERWGRWIVAMSVH
jgi:hypothetical protein